MLTSNERHSEIAQRAGATRETAVRRELDRLRPDARGALCAPPASLRAVGAARRALAWRPELVYCWNGASLPQAALRVLADSGVPLAFRVCEHWFGGLFLADQYMRELASHRRAPGRARGRRLPRAQRSAARCALIPSSGAHRDLVELRGDPRDGEHAAVPRAGARARRPLGATPWRAVRGGRSATRRPSPRSPSWGASPPTRAWPSRSRRSRCCARRTASRARLVVIGPEDAGSRRPSCAASPSALVWPAR